MNGDRTTNQLPENDSERSPGPHMEEMTNGAEGEDDFSEMDESVNFMNSEEMVEVGNFDPDLRRVKVQKYIHLSNFLRLFILLFVSILTSH